MHIHDELDAAMDHNLRYTNCTPRGSPVEPSVVAESLPAEQVVVALLERQRRRVVSGGDGVSFALASPRGCE